MSHLRVHISQNETLSCPFKNCIHSTNVATTFRGHISKKHHGLSFEDIKEEYVLHTCDSKETDDNGCIHDEDQEEMMDISFDPQETDGTMNENHTEIERMITHNMALFLLKMNVDRKSVV